MRSYFEACGVELFELSGRKVPAAMLGTSPFCGAGQFRSRAEVYYQRFYERPKNMVRLIAASAKLGVPAVHAVTYPRICRAVEDAIEECGIQICVIGTIGLGRLEEELKDMAALNAAGVALHAEVIDPDPSAVDRYAVMIRESGAALGIATHRPWKTIPKLLEADLDFIMAPVNKLGYMMGPRPDQVLELLASINIPIIAIKPLAAGELRPREAFDFLKNKVDAVAVGIASMVELEETWRAFKERFSPRGGT